MRILTILALSFGFSLFAHDAEEIGTLKGDKLYLSYTDHAMAGQVNGKLVYASPSDKGGITLIHRSNGEDFKSSFESAGGSAMAGEIVTTASKKTTKTSFKVTKMNGAAGTFEGTLDGKAFTVKISSNKKSGAHYIDPTYDVSLDGKTYSFQLDGGQACPFCSTKIAFVVVGMLRHTGAL